MTGRHYRYTPTSYVELGFWAFHFKFHYRQRCEWEGEILTQTEHTLNSSRLGDFTIVSAAWTVRSPLTVATRAHRLIGARLRGARPVDGRI